MDQKLVVPGELAQEGAGMFDLIREAVQLQGERPRSASWVQDRPRASAQRSLARPGSSPPEGAAQVESQQTEQFRIWRGELAEELSDPSLSNLELVFAERSSPQEVTVHEQGNPDAIALDRRMVSFLVRPQNGFT